MKTNNTELINKYLQLEYSDFIHRFSADNILGTFTVGLGNYGFAEELKDLQFVTVYLPTFEELCNPIMEHNGSTTTLGKMFDIRYVYQILQQTDSNTLELLFSNYYIITPKYKEIFETYFLNNREIIAHLNMHERFTKGYKRIIEAFTAGNDFEAARLHIACTLFSKGYLCNDCFHIQDNIYKSYLWNCKDGTTEIDRAEILSDMEELIADSADDVDYEASSYIKKGIVELVHEALKERVPLDSFIDCLTSTELKAWEHLQTKLTNGTVTVSVSKIIEETDISRPIWKNLFSKLENSNIAKITNCGVKGTTIQLL